MRFGSSRCPPRGVEAIGGALSDRGIKVETTTGADVGEAALRGQMMVAAIRASSDTWRLRQPEKRRRQQCRYLVAERVILARSGDTYVIRRDESDGRLYAFELMGRDLPSLDLLALSACETGRGDERASTKNFSTPA